MVHLHEDAAVKVENANQAGLGVLTCGTDLIGLEGDETERQFTQHPILWLVLNPPCNRHCWLSHN